MNETIREVIAVLNTMTDAHQRCVLEMIYLLKEAWEDN